MHEEMKQAILQKIEEYPRIFLFRHIRGDGDCIGATKALKEIIRLTWPEKQVLLIDDDPPAPLEFLGQEDAPVAEECYAGSLGIVLDTASTARISNQNYALCREIIKIDHHIPVEDFGTLSWVEEKRTSCCEMITEFYCTFRQRLKINIFAATCLYTGIVTDTGRFQYTGVNGETLRYAAVLLDMGVDTDMLFARLYLEDYNALKFKAAFYAQMQITENGVAYIYISRAMQEEFGLTYEQAGACVDDLATIRGCLCWIAFIESDKPQPSIRVRLRSRFVPINQIAEHFRGGGHAHASGATLYAQQEVQAMLDEADSAVKAYKETHEDWL